jgi:hypothetical protein
MIKAHFSIGSAPSRHRELPTQCSRRKWVPKQKARLESRAFAFAIIAADQQRETMPQRKPFSGSKYLTGRLHEEE